MVEFEKTWGKNWELAIAGNAGKGEASLLDRFTDRIESRQIRLLGYLNLLKDEFAAADVLLVTSYYEALSLVMLEGLAEGLPIITTPVNGAAETVTSNWNGYIVNWRSAEVAEALHRLARDRELRDVMSKNSRLRSLDFTPSEIALLTEKAYHSSR